MDSHRRVVTGAASVLCVGQATLATPDDLAAEPATAGRTMPGSTRLTRTGVFTTWT